MQINGQRIHYDYFRRFCGNQRRSLLREQPVKGDPGILRLKVAFHPQLLPIPQFLFEIGMRRFGLQTERMPAQINAVFAAFCFRNVEALTEVGKRIAGVHRNREVFAGPKSVPAHDASSSGVSSLRISASALLQSRSSMRSIPPQSSVNMRSWAAPRRSAVAYGMRWNVTMAYFGTKRLGYFASKASSTLLRKRNLGSATRSRISTKFSTARSAIASVLTFLACSNSSNTHGQTGPWRSSRSRKQVQSSNPQLMPCPKKGTIAWAASPSRSARPSTCQGEHLMVTIAPVGLAKKLSASSGISDAASGNRDWKNPRTSAGPGSCAKLSGPSKGRNKMLAKVPSTLGSAISIKLPRGQM